MNIRNCYMLSLLVLMSGLLYASEKKDIPPVDQAEEVQFRAALLLQNAEQDQKFLVSFIAKHPDYLNEIRETSLISVFSGALVVKGCDTKIYKTLFKEFLKYDSWTILHNIFVDEPASSDESSKIDETVDLAIQKRRQEAFTGLVREAWQELVTEACAAVRKQDAQELDRLIGSWPLLITPPDYLKAESTILHEAVKMFDSKKPQTVVIFSHLMKKGASWTAKNAAGVSVEESVKQGHAAFESFTHLKHLRENPSPITYDSVKEKIVGAKPHWKYIFGGVVAVICVYALWPKRDSLRNELDLGTMSKPLL